MNPLQLIEQLRAIVHAPPHMFTQADRQRARDALAMIHTGRNR